MSQPPKIWNCAFAVCALMLYHVIVARATDNDTPPAGNRRRRRDTMSKKFYAVQIGNDYSSDWGSTRKREAIVMAHQAARENPGKEIRISICTTDDDFCERQIIIREGSRA